MKFIKQHDSRDCAAACLSMIAFYYGIKCSIGSLRKLMKTDINGTSIYGIIKAAKYIGFDAEALFGTIDEIIEDISKKEIHLPLIAHVNNDDNMGHFIVIYKITKNKIYVVDPASGKKKLSIDEFNNIWTGKIVIFVNNKSCYEEKRSNNIIKIILNQKKRILVVMSVSFIISIIGILITLILRSILDYSIYMNGKIDINILIYSFIAVNMLFIIMQYIRGRIESYISPKLELEISKAYIDKYLKGDIENIFSRESGDYIVLHNNIRKISDDFIRIVISVFFDGVMSFLCAMILLYYSKTLFLIIWVCILLYVLCVQLYKNKIDCSVNSIMNLDASVQHAFKEMVTATETIKILSLEKKINERYINVKEKQMEGYIKSKKLLNQQNTIKNLVDVVGNCIVIVIGLKYIYQGKFSVGDFISFVSLMGIFFAPIKNMVEIQFDIRDIWYTVDCINEILEVEQKHDGVLCLDTIDTIKLDNVGFRYGYGKIVFDNINIELKRGYVYSINGNNGSGKTTLAKLILKLYKPIKGRILFSDIPLNKIETKIIREKVAYVGANSFLFSDTIISNLTIVGTEADIFDIQEICKKCKIHDDIINMPLGYNTVLVENGLNLSSGQRQKINIARILLKNPDVIIWDEATTNLDENSQRDILGIIRELSKDKICIIISHDNTVNSFADRIIWI